MAVRAAPVASIAAALALAVAGCGDEERQTARAGDDSAERGTTTGDIYLPPRLGPSEYTGERAQAAEVVLDVQEGLVTGTGDSVCFELTKAEERRLMRSGGGPLRYCGDVVEETIDRWRAADEAPVLAPLGRVEIDGDEALVTVKDAERGRYQVLVVRRDREWELPHFDLDRSPGLRPVE